jgi:outer membrane receptor protein involved in Fe transport
LLVFVGFGMTATVRAQPSAFESPEPLEQIVVTAQKREERSREVPISLAVLNGAEVDTSSLIDVTDALNTMPGVAATVGYQGGATLINVRGVGASGSLFEGSSPIAYYLDSAPFGFVTSAIAPDPGSYDLQRIEVLRGPQGTLYGANALNGVVRVLTNDADLDAFALKARLAGSGTDGGGGNARGDFAVNAPIVPGKVAVRGVLGYSDLGGWIDSPVAEDINDAQLRTYRLKLDSRPTDALTLGVSAWRSRNDYGAPSAAADDGRVSALLPQPIVSDYDVYGVTIGYELSRISLSSSTTSLRYENHSVWDLRAAGLPDITLSTDLDTKAVAEEIVLSSVPGGGLQWTAGVMYRDAREGLFQSSLILPAPLDYTFGSESYAVFGEVRRPFLDGRLEGTLGLRHFRDDVLNEENTRGDGLAGPLYHSTASFDATSPRMVLAWRPKEGLIAYASYSEGFRSGFPQNAGVIAVVPGFPPLQPDTLRTYEIGTKAELSDRLSIDGALYSSRWNDVQQSLAVLYSGVPLTANVNGDSASGVGADFGVTLQPSERLTLGVALAWNDLTFDSDVYVPGGLLFHAGDRLNYSPELTGGFSAEYRVRLGRRGLEGVVAGSADYRSSVSYRGNNTGTIVNEGGSLLISRASFAVTMDRWALSVFVDNLNNEDSATPTVTLIPEWQLRVRPRTVGAQFSYSR